jgi:hypothetical protein
MTTDYKKEYRKNYKRKNKIMSFPISQTIYDKLEKRSAYYDLTANSYTKNIVINYLNNDNNSLLTKDRQNFISDYIRISR